jgi:hypothetical protein
MLGAIKLGRERMRKGPRGQRRSADVVSNGDKVNRTATSDAGAPASGSDGETWERNFHRSGSLVLTILAFLFGRSRASK